MELWGVSAGCEGEEDDDAGVRDSEGRQWLGEGRAMIYDL